MATVFPAAYTSIVNVVVCDGTTAIGARAFDGCSGLKSVAIPATVTNIGNSAFSGCDGLKSVTIPQCVCSSRLSTVFPSAYQSLTNVVICDGATSIGSYAFYDCGRLASVVIPDSVTSIGSSAFSGCSGLKSVTIPQCVCSSRMSTVFPSAYQSITNVVICDGTTTIGAYAFEGCTGLKSMVIPDSVTSIGNYAFADCRRLEDMTIPSTVTSIGSGVLRGCGSLKTLTVPFVGASRNATGSNAVLGYFFGSSSYPGGVATTQYYYYNSTSESSTTYYIPETLKSVMVTDTTTIGDGAFSGCGGLVDVTFPDSVINIGNRAFSGCSGLSTISIPAAVRRVGAYAFAGCEDLIDIETVPNVQLLDGWVLGSFGTISGTLDLSRMRGVASSAFHGCDKITEIQFGDGVLSIGANAFAGCNGLTSVVVPDNVMYIGEGAFGWCRNLREISVPFVGSCRGNVGVADALFGWIFGSTGYQTGPSSYTYYSGYTTAVEQWYDSSSSKTYYIPNSLVKVAITDESTVGFGAFGGCVNLVDVSLPSGVGSIGGYAFSGCSGLKRLRLEGNAPSVGAYAFHDVNENCCARVHEASSGWGVDIPGVWRGIGIRYIEERVEFVAAPVIAPPDGTVFAEESCTVTISCETDGVEIYYSSSGKTPKVSEAYKYKGPFTITNSATIKAVAVYEDGETTVKSDYATAMITKRTLTLAEAASANAATAALTWSTGGDGGWVPVFDETTESGLSARSGAIRDGGLSWMTTRVYGSGTLGFKWKTDCEWDDSGDATWDHLAVLTNASDGTWIEVARIDGTTPWSDMAISFTGANTHIVRWEYSKDESDLDGEDCAWVSGVLWTPNVDAGLAAWLAERNLTADARAANGRTAAECYALGLDPADATNDFRIVSIELVNGKPKVEWEPKTNRWTGAEIQAVLKGAASLDGEWQTVTEENKAGFRFFKVVVEVP